MPRIRFAGVTKSFGDVTVIERFDAEIPDGEFLVLLGPSGSGKSTMLRMIAGLTGLTGGTLEFDGRKVNDLAPDQRDVAFVFQSAALYPHLSVRANIAFPLMVGRFRWYHHLPVAGRALRRAFVRDAEVNRRIERAAASMRVTEFLDRRPRALSGGQRRRVALARELVREPSLYLLDEPLTGLDGPLRTELRAEIGALYHRTGTSFVYVTHDQDEAMSMATRVIVLNDGVVQQYGTPGEVYESPANTFVARFVGSPPMNLLPGPLFGGAGDDVLIGVRAERVTVGPPDGEGVPAQVAGVERRGAESVVAFRLGPPGRSGDLHHARIPGDVRFAPGDPCRVRPDLTGAPWFDRRTGKRIESVTRPTITTER
ncbi:ABC transporter ATP-binding protein [Spongiactinospora rosea]|uniref:ABC transporter ATP-binding protein n=1 Tax=Spongiactinospora rosea TaxID=2248750 RepID=A0A366LKW3_9ACTN|nr:ABC transporter ATP-binding protein [Spongiactinospora rosea]RBQ14558.1 ABC transporter ATP-binding protein [Spongiactinospora rosea]